MTIDSPHISSARGPLKDALGLSAVLAVPYMAMVYAYWFVCDDAFITFRYSRNLANGLGARYNLGDHVPVEGYSNFLWMLLAAACEAVGIDPAVLMPMLSIGTGLVTLVLVMWSLRKHFDLSLMLTGAAGLAVAIFPPFAVWSTSGLATMPQTFFMLAAFVFLVLDDDEHAPRWAGLAGLGLALVRTEGIAWCVVIGGLALLVRALQGRKLVRPLGQYGAVVLGPYALYWLWRFSYYQSVVANTATAKVHMTSSTLVRGMSYLGLYVTTLITPLFLLLSIPVGAAKAAADRRWAVLAIGAMAVGVPAYGMVVSGDYMTWFRILVPGVPFYAMSLALAAHGMARHAPQALPAVGLVAIAGLSVLPAADIYLVPQSVRADLQVRDKLGFFRTENKQWEAMTNHSVTWKEKGQALAAFAPANTTYVAAAIGNVGYFSDLHILDRNGLVNREVAAQPWSGELRSPGHDKVVDRRFFFDAEPTILDSKVVGWPGIETRAKGALREMAFSEVSRTYYPALYPAPGNRKIPRYLIALVRADDADHATTKTKHFHDDLAALASHGARPGAPVAFATLTELLDNVELARPEATDPTPPVERRNKPRGKVKGKRRGAKGGKP
ncbi:MAG: hypothetical protein ACON5B_06480 [Myxococcota bacterium]